MSSPTEKQILSVIFMLEEAMRELEARSPSNAWIKLRQAQLFLEDLVSPSSETMVNMHKDLTNALISSGYRRSAARLKASDMIQRLGTRSGLEPMIIAALQELSRNGAV